MNDKLCSLVYYFIKRNPNLNRTELVKLSYLTDYNFYKYFNKDITGTIYKYHNHGPFSKTVYDCIDKLKEDNTIKENKNISFSNQRKYFSYEIKEEFNMGKYLNKQELEILDFVVLEYGNLGYEKLTDISYKTEPMKNAKRGDVLDFGVINKSIEDKIANVKKESGSLDDFLDISPKFEDKNGIMDYQYKVMSN